MAAKKTSASSGVEDGAVKTAAAKKSTGAAKKPAPATQSARSTPAKKASATAKKTAPAAKSAAKKTPPASKTTAKKTAPAPKTAVNKASPGAKKTAPAKPTVPAGGKRSDRAAAKLEYREGEKPWTTQEIADVKAALQGDAARLREEIGATEAEIGHLLREGGEGAGNDQADVGSNTFERDHEMSMAKNARANLELVEAALERIDGGSYGICESCGQPIGKMRLQAFPRATLCLECKQREERR